jgi:hypothetical protein
MGADYTAIAVIGIEIDEKKIPVTKHKEKTFNHNYPETVKYCPDTGKPLWKKWTTPNFTFDPDQESDETKLIKLMDIEVFKGTDDKPVILGYGTNDTDSNGGNDYSFVNMPDINLIKTSLKNALEPYGMWKESEFGLYSVLYCSY